VGADNSANQHPEHGPNAGSQRRDECPQFISPVEAAVAGESAHERAGAGTGKKPYPDANGDMPLGPRLTSSPDILARE